LILRLPASEDRTRAQRSAAVLKVIWVGDVQGLEPSTGGHGRRQMTFDTMKIPQGQVK